jgi:O-antigen/teichoic acid export membrane protein
VQSPRHLILVPIIFGLSHLTASLYLLAIAKQNTYIPRLRLTKGAGRNIFRAAVPLGISSAMIQVYYHLDSVIIGLIRTSQELGYYSAAYKVILFLVAVADAFALALLPTLSRLAGTHGLDKLRSTLPHLLRLLTWLGLGLTIGIFCLARDVIAFLYGSVYLPGTTALTILSIMIFLVFASLSFSVLLLSIGREKRYAVAVSWGAATNLILNIILIPLYGITGAAIATVLSGVAVWFLFLWFVRDLKLSIPWFSLALRLTIPGALTVTALEMISDHVIVRAAGGALVYLLSSRLAGVWSFASLRTLARNLSQEPN